MVSIPYYSMLVIAENGGRIRGTNGNNHTVILDLSAEGVDPDEIPVTAIADNKFKYVATSQE